MINSEIIIPNDYNLYNYKEKRDEFVSRMITKNKMNTFILCLNRCSRFYSDDKYIYFQNSFPHLIDKILYYCNENINKFTLCLPALNCNRLSVLKCGCNKTNVGCELCCYWICTNKFTRNNSITLFSFDNVNYSKIYNIIKMFNLKYKYEKCHVRLLSYIDSIDNSYENINKEYNLVYLSDINDIDHLCEEEKCFYNHNSSNILMVDKGDKFNELKKEEVKNDKYYSIIIDGTLEKIFKKYDNIKESDVIDKSFPYYLEKYESDAYLNSESKKSKNSNSGNNFEDINERINWYGTIEDKPESTFHFILSEQDLVDLISSYII